MRGLQHRRCCRRPACLPQLLQADSWRPERLLLLLLLCLQDSGCAGHVLELLVPRLQAPITPAAAEEECTSCVVLLLLLVLLLVLLVHCKARKAVQHAAPPRPSCSLITLAPAAASCAGARIPTLHHSHVIHRVRMAVARQVQQPCALSTCCRQQSELRQAQGGHCGALLCLARRDARECCLELLLLLEGLCCLHQEVAEWQQLRKLQACSAVTMS
jgi:hypothetical protein